jgi:hypothetical protein
MKKFWYILSTLLAVLIPTFTPAVQNYVVAHAPIAMILGTAWTVLGNLLTPPVAISITPTAPATPAAPTAPKA